MKPIIDEPSDDLDRVLNQKVVRIVNALKINKNFMATIEPQWHNVSLLQESQQTQQSLIAQLLLTL